MWDGSDRKERLPENWPRIRAEVLKRDGYRCTWKLPSGARCPRRATDVDHRKPGDDHRKWNLQSLCSDHHARKSAQEGVSARKARKASRLRATEAHPGALG